jgi:hypothetical protein
MQKMDFFMCFGLTLRTALTYPCYPYRLASGLVAIGIDFHQPEMIKGGSAQITPARRFFKF